MLNVIHMVNCKQIGRKNPTRVFPGTQVLEQDNPQCVTDRQMNKSNRGNPHLPGCLQR